MPHPGGRPPLPPDERRGALVKVYVTPGELAELDRRRGEVGRSEWLVRAAGLRGRRG